MEETVHFLSEIPNNTFRQDTALIDVFYEGTIAPLHMQPDDFLTLTFDFQSRGIYETYNWRSDMNLTINYIKAFTVTNQAGFKLGIGVIFGEGD